MQDRLVSGVKAERLTLLNRQGMTRLDPESIDRLALAFECESDARVIVLEGVSGSFCEGLDVEALVTAESDTRRHVSGSEFLRRFAGLIECIQQTPQPVIALVDGPALGGGLGLAAAADLVLATPRASFGLPETLLGLIPAVIFPTVARRIGVSKARLLALGAQTLSARAALEAGLVDEIVDDLEESLNRYAKRLSRMDLRATGQLKNLVARYFQPPTGYLDAAVAGFHDLLSTPETQLRIDRFTAGETPWPEEN